MSLASELVTTFLIGLATPLTALCVIPLYPGFLSYMGRQLKQDATRRTYALFGMLVVAGVISFMIIFGLIFTTFLETSLTGAIGLISPIAFGILAGVSILMMLDFDFSRFIPEAQSSGTDNPLINAFGFGFFFGAIVLPCNPGMITLFLGRSLLFTSPLTSMMNFLSFGIGMGFPLLFFALISSNWSQKIISVLTSNRELINRGTGALMFVISIYYLFFVFEILTF